MRLMIYDQAWIAKSALRICLASNHESCLSLSIKHQGAYQSSNLVVLTTCQHQRLHCCLLHEIIPSSNNKQAQEPCIFVHYYNSSSIKWKEGKKPKNSSTWQLRRGDLRIWTLPWSATSYRLSNSYTGIKSLHPSLRIFSWKLLLTTIKYCINAVKI